MQAERQRSKFMPQVSTFYGIGVYMYYRDHAPPHFHAIYGEHEAVIGIAAGDTLEGKLPRRAARMVAVWWAAHEHELMENWELAQAGEPLNDIPGLD